MTKFAGMNKYSAINKPPRDEPRTAGQDVLEAIGQSDTFLAFQEHLSKVATVNRPVLLVGERGTGKELAAQRLHFLSQRWDAPFIALNCAALSPTLMESELFGHEAGAFTGAGARRTGRFEAAQSGTLFLDEIGNIPLEVQSKILRVVEYHTFERVGSSAPTKVDVRIVGATNVDLQMQAERGKFMRDLLDRLSFDVLVLPPLRDRREDIEILANHFAARMAYELGWENVPEITEGALRRLQAHTWSGNVRELKNVIERAVYLSDDSTITEEELVFDPFRAYARRTAPNDTPAPDQLDSSRDQSSASANGIPPRTESAPIPSRADLLPSKADLSRPLPDCIRELELRMLQCALEEAKFNQRRAAELLGLTYHQFRGLYRKYQPEIAS